MIDIKFDVKGFRASKGVISFKRARKNIKSSPISNIAAAELLYFIQTALMEQDSRVVGAMASISPVTMALKKKVGLSGHSDSRYVFQGNFVKQLAYRIVRKEGFFQSADVGAFPDIVHKTSGLSMSKLLYLLEHGGKMPGTEIIVPARPLMGPALKAFSEDKEKGFESVARLAADRLIAVFGDPRAGVGFRANQVYASRRRKIEGGLKG